MILDMKIWRRALAILVVSIVVGPIWVHALPPTKPKRPNIIILLIDTLRADHLGMYGFKRDTSPNLDEFAAQSTKFTRAISSSNWTPASVASLFTGLYPTSHGINPHKAIIKARKSDTNKLTDKNVTITTALKSVGYQTAAVSSNPWIGPSFGYGPGFDQFREIMRLDADHVVSAAEEMVDGFAQNPDQPFFLYLHFMDPHNPYLAHEESAGMFTDDLSLFFNFKYPDHRARPMQLYDGEIRNADHYIGQFFDSLKRRGLYDQARIILISDHGEQFTEHGKKGHGRYLYSEEVRVPLVLKTDNKGRVVDDVVSNIDVLPTIYEIVGLPMPNGLPGISLLDDSGRKKRVGVFSEVYRDYPQQAFTDQIGNRIIYDITLDPNGQYLRTLRGVYNLNQDKLEQVALNDLALEKKLSSYLDAEYRSAQKLMGLNSTPMNN